MTSNRKTTPSVPNLGSTGSATPYTIYHPDDGTTEIHIPSFDINGRPFHRVILVRGEVLDMGREQA